MICQEISKLYQKNTIKKNPATNPICAKMVGGLWLFWTAALKKVSVPLSSLAPSKNTKTNTNTIHIQNIQQVKYRDTKTRQKAKDKQDS